MNAKFICQDIRTITFDEEFDVVLNMADGAIGYLEDDGENHKDFFCHCESIKKWWKALYGYHEWKLCPNTFPLQVMGCRRKGLTLSALNGRRIENADIWAGRLYVWRSTL